MTTEGRMGRENVEILWPATLELPLRPPKLIYLDLNHWVNLAKAFSGHSDGARHADALAALVDAANRGVAVVPLSDSIYTEVGKMKQHRQRRHLREVIEAVSRYAVVTARPVVSTHEVETMLDLVVGINPTPINTMRYLDWGLARAFGMVGGFRIYDKIDGRDVTAKARRNWPEGAAAFDAWLASAELALNRCVLEGPSSPEEEAHLKRLGYRSDGHVATAERRAQQEVEQTARFDMSPNWRRGRIRDVIAARELLIELTDIVSRGLTERGMTIEDAFPDEEDARHAFDSMPSFDVAVTLKASYHRDPNHRWKVNDITDIDALCSTIPYCDVVVTDKAVASHANRTGLAERFATVVTAQLSEVIDRHL